MAPNASELKIQSLRIRIWLRVAFCILYVAAALFCAFIHSLESLIGAILLVAFAAINGIVIRRSKEELSRLRDNEPNPDCGTDMQNMTLAQLQTRAHELRVRTWSSIVAAAMFTSGALFFVLRQNIIAALPLIGLAAISARIITRSAEEGLRLRECGPQAE